MFSPYVRDTTDVIGQGIDVIVLFEGFRSGQEGLYGDRCPGALRVEEKGDWYLPHQRFVGCVDLSVSWVDL